MAWVKIPPEHHPLFRAALPSDPRIETMQMFGGVAAKVNGHLFAGLFGRSAMLLLPEADLKEALALDGAAPFDPMGRGVRSDKVMLPEGMMKNAPELRRWIARAFEAAALLPAKGKKPGKAAKSASKPAPKSAAPRAKPAPKKTASRPTKPRAKATKPKKMVRTR